MLSTSPRLDHLLKRIPVTAIPPIHSIAARMTKCRSFTIPAKRTGMERVPAQHQNEPRPSPGSLLESGRLCQGLPMENTHGSDNVTYSKTTSYVETVCLTSTIEIYMPIVESSRANLRKKKVRNRQLSHKILKLNWLHVEIFFLWARLVSVASFSQKEIPQFDRFTEPPT